MAAVIDSERYRSDSEGLGLHQIYETLGVIGDESDVKDGVEQREKGMAGGR